jgi:Tfp pilus assembly protein PilV
VTATSDKRRLRARLRDEEGIGLIELMMALLVLNIGIFATLAAFTSGALTLRRASHASTAAAIADKYMESYRNSSYSSIPPASCATPVSSASNVTGADSLTYTLAVNASCGSQMSTGTYKGSTAVKIVTLTVKGPNPSTQVLDTSSSTFSECTQAALGTDTNPCQT